MKPVTVANVTYKSLAAAWRAWSGEGVTYALVRKRISRGWLPEPAIIVPPIPPALRRNNI